MQQSGNCLPSGPISMMGDMAQMRHFLIIPVHGVFLQVLNLVCDLDLAL